MSSERLNQLDKISKVKKASRLSEFFGEALSPEDLKKQISSPLTPGAVVDEEIAEKDSPRVSHIVEEIDVLKKKWQKLRAFLGERVSLGAIMNQKRSSLPGAIMNQKRSSPPQDSSLTSLVGANEDLESESPSSAQKYLDILSAMSVVIKNSKDLIELLGAFSILDPAIETDPEAAPSNPWKKILKLEGLFGSDLAVESLFKQIETQIICDAEKWIFSQVTEEEDKSLIKAELDRLRRNIFAKVSIVAQDYATQ